MMLNEPCTIQVRTYFTVNVEVLDIYIYTFIAMNNYITTYTVALLYRSNSYLRGCR